jgi:septal ring factor EnvC (AmiA/AmiB activator)
VYKGKSIVGALLSSADQEQAKNDTLLNRNGDLSETVNIITARNSELQNDIEHLSRALEEATAVLKDFEDRRHNEIQRLTEEHVGRSAEGHNQGNKSRE